MTNIIADLDNAVTVIGDSVTEARVAYENAGEKYKDFVNEVKVQKVAEAKAAYEAARSSSSARINAALQNFYAELDQWDALDGEKLTNDAKLLGADVPLTEKDINEMYSRALKDQNRTMMNLIARKADERDIKLNTPHYPIKAYKDAADRMAQYAKNAVTDVFGMFKDIWKNRRSEITPECLIDLYGLEKPYRYNNGKN